MVVKTMSRIIADTAKFAQKDPVVLSFIFPLIPLLYVCRLLRDTGLVKVLCRSSEAIQSTRVMLESRLQAVLCL